MNDLRSLIEILGIVIVILFFTGVILQLIELINRNYKLHKYALVVADVIALIIIMIVNITASYVLFKDIL